MVIPDNLAYSFLSKCQINYVMNSTPNDYKKAPNDYKKY